MCDEPTLQGVLQGSGCSGVVPEVSKIFGVDLGVVNNQVWLKDVEGGTCFKHSQKQTVGMGKQEDVTFIGRLVYVWLLGIAEHTLPKTNSSPLKRKRSYSKKSPTEPTVHGPRKKLSI